MPASRSPSPTADDKAESSTSANSGEEKVVENESNSDSSKENEESEQPVASTSASLPPGTHVQGDWQAIWSPQHNNYYFYNSKTNETTWSNPLAASALPQESHLTQSQSQPLDPAQAAIAAGIDPELAFLDPTLGVPNPAATAVANGAFQAKFNARTGAFTKMDARDPSHLGEWERMQRMSTVYFDTAAYDREVQKRKNEEEASEGKKKKKVTKKDLERFKEQKRLKKIAKTAWLRT